MTPATTLLATLAAVILISLPVEALAARPERRRLAPGAMPARAALSAALTALWLGLLGRPILAGIAAVVTIALGVAISRQKRRLVAEPLVFSDVALLALVVRHPDLYYLGFLTDPRWIAGALGLAGTLTVWIILEPPMLAGAARLTLTAAVIYGVLGLFGLAAVKPVAGLLRSALPRPDLERDVGRWGLLLTLIAYGLRWRAEHPAESHPDDGPVSDRPGSSTRPDLVVVLQLESFVDPAQHGLAAEPLPGLARARSRAVLHGPLRVPTHGAFTMRTEYAVLTGHGGSESGFRSFDPYLSTRGGAPPTVASRLRARGYRTVFLHPFRAGFFNRETVMPRLGFDEMLWEEDFAGAERAGPYVSDAALVARILAEAKRSAGRPALIAAVSMENHGPWPEGRWPDAVGPTAGYLLHLGNSDRAILALLDGLDDWPGRALVCLYGDHTPILPEIDQSRPPETVYALVECGRGATASTRGRSETLTAGELGRRLARRALGFDDDGTASPP